MKFSKDGKLKIMQITDIQEGAKVSVDTMKLLESAVKSEKPDLVIYTGDQIKGYDVSYKGKSKEKLADIIGNTIDTILKPVTSRNIPFAVTFGNHDCQTGISNKEQFEKFYKSYPSCLGVQAEGIDGGGTYNIPVKSSDGSRTALSIYLIYSGTDTKNGGYEPVDKNIINWYKETREKLKEENSDYVPSLVFQHIPLCEHYNVLKKVSKRTKGAIPAFRTHKGEFYIIDKEKCSSDSVLLEPPSIPDINTGEFDAFKEKGEVFGVYVGHDHKNSYVGKYQGIDLGFTQSSGFSAYGNGKERGVRIFILDENNPKEYQTYTKTYRQLCDGKLQKPITDAIGKMAPTNFDMAKPMIAKAVGILACIIAAAVLLIKYL